MPRFSIAAAAAVFLSVLAMALQATATIPDFIIVGGGTSGCTLAARLCVGLPAARIIVLERGPSRNATEEFKVRSPRQVAAALATPSIATAWASAPSAGAGGRPLVLLTAATLGGSSSINAAQWSEPVGADAAGWGVDGLDADTARAAYARAASTLGVARPPPPLRYAYGDAWLAAARRAGLPTVADETGRQARRGAWLNRLAVTPSGRRVDACTAYVAPALRGACAGRLTVRTGVTVTAVRLEGGTRNAGADKGDGGPTRATGVEVVATKDGPAGRPRTLRARRAVISAAGPYGTPQLLLLSGIGRPADLSVAGVTPRVDLPVGQGAVLRPMVGVSGEYTGVPLAAVNNATELGSAAARAAWAAGRGGVLGMASTMGIGRVATGRGAYIIASFTSLVRPPGTPDYTSVCMINPASRGRLSLADGSAWTPPTVTTGMLDEAADVATAVACVRRLRRVLRAFAPGFGMKETVPGGGVDVDEAVVRATAISGLHYVGTAAVGRVLDGDLGVKGVDGLYVVDASAIPSMPRSAGPMSSVYMLAEHTAERLIRRYRRGCGA